MDIYEEYLLLEAYWKSEEHKQWLILAGIIQKDY